MDHPYGTWSPYAGGSSIILAGVLFLVSGVLIFFAVRFHHPGTIQMP